jgi:hypothetical protein
MCAIGVQNIYFSVYVSLASTKLYVVTLKRPTKTIPIFSSTSIHRYLYCPPFIKCIQLVETQIHFLSTVSVKVNDYNIKSVCMWYYSIILEAKCPLQHCISVFALWDVKISLFCVPGVGILRLKHTE